ncbi:MAG: fibronectin type III domain-containing protein [Thermoplasmatota archaeon]
MDGGKRFRGKRGIFAISQVFLLVIAGLAALLIVETGDSSGTVLFVGSSSTYTSVSQAIENATSGDLIRIAPGTYNENLTIPSGVSVMGNDTSTTIIDSDMDVAVHLTGTNSDLSNLKVRGGSILISGSSHDLMNIMADSSDHAALVIEGTSRIFVHNLTVSDPVTSSILVSNSVNVTFEELNVQGAEDVILKVTDSREITVKSSLMNMRDDAVGFSGRNLTTVEIDQVIFSDSGIQNVGMDLFNITDLRIDGSIFNLTGTGIAIDIGYSIALANDIIEVEGAEGIGLDLDTCSNVSVAFFSLNVIEGKAGIEAMLTSNMTVENGTFTIEGSNAIGIHGQGLRNLQVKDCNGIVMGTGSALFNLKNSDRMLIANNIISLVSGSARGILIDRSTNSTIRTNFLSSSSDDCMNAGIGSGSRNILFMDNRIDTSGDRSTGLYIAGSGKINVRDNNLDISGELSQGYLVVNSAVSFSGEDITASSLQTVGLNSSGSSLRMDGSVVTAAGPDSKAVDLYWMISAVVNNTEFYGSAEGSMGIMSRGQASRLEIEASMFVMNHESGHAVRVEIPEGHIGVSRSVMASTAPEVPLYINSGSAEIETVQITSDLGDVIFWETPNASIRNSILSGSIPVTAIRSTVMMDTVVLNGTSYSLAAVDNSLVELLDTTVSSPQIGTDSVIFVRNRIYFKTQDRGGNPFGGVELKIENFGSQVYATQYFNQTDPDPRTDDAGMIPVQKLLFEYYEGNPSPVREETEIEVFATGSSGTPWSEVLSIDTSYPHMEVLISPDIDLPMTPSNFSIRQTDTLETLFLNWDANDDDTIEYWIHSLDPDSGSQVIAVKLPFNKTSWMTEDLGPSKKMFYWVTAWDGTWESEPSEIRSGTTRDLTPPLPPSDLFFMGSTKDSITIRWIHQGGPDLEGFRIFINDPSTGIDFRILEDVPDDVRSYTATGLDWGSTYRFKVQAFDQSDNFSPFGPVLSAATLLPRIEVTISATFGPEGPRADEPASNCTIELRGFNGTLVATSKTDEFGNATLSGLDADEAYEVRVIAPAGLRGEMGLRTGYIEATTGQFLTDPFNETVHFNLTLDYYVRIVNGSIRVRVEYGEGPRSGGVYQAIVKMVGENGDVRATLETVFDGTADFIVSDLPLRGRFEVIPPEGVRGDPDLQRSGYLSATTNFFELTFEDPDQDFGNVTLDYYLYERPPEELQIYSRSPDGNAVNLEAPIQVIFNQPVDTSSVESSFVISPGLVDPVFTWSSDNTTLTVTHADLLADTEYTVTIGNTAVSEDGTYFPQGYTNNTWSFRTTALPGESEENNTRYVIYGIFAVMIIIIIVILVYSRVSSSKEEDGRPPFGDYDDIEDEEYDDEYYDEDYPDDLAEQMGEDMEFGEEEDYYDEEEFLEDGEELVEVEEEEAEDSSEEEHDEDIEEERVTVKEEMEIEEEEEPAEDPVEDEMEEVEEEETVKKTPKKKKKKGKNKRR